MAYNSTHTYSPRDPRHKLKALLGVATDGYESFWMYVVVVSLGFLAFAAACAAWVAAVRWVENRRARTR